MFSALSACSGCSCMHGDSFVKLRVMVTLSFHNCMLDMTGSLDTARGNRKY